ncbi:MAG: sulfatase-like hydrolase/transferase [Planctomycetota bacterium]
MNRNRFITVAQTCCVSILQLSRRRTFTRLNPFGWGIATLCVLLPLFACCDVQAQQKPNIVFFLVDDLGQRDLGCYGSQFYETPAIDQLAKDGMLFDNAYSTCHVCSPSRASILTGKYPARTNLTEWLGGRPEEDYEKLHHGEKLTALPDSEKTLAETLQDNGYATANYGKAHLNRDPTSYGFDEAITGWVRSYYHPFSASYEETLPAEEGDYYTDKLTDAAIDFIQRNKDRPFFVHLEHFSVHDPIQGRKDLVEKYTKKLAAMPPEDGPDFILEPNPDGHALSANQLRSLGENDDRALHQKERVWWVKQKQDNVQFAGMVEATDESLGRIRAKLKELGLEENTMIVFSADNGGMAASNQYRGIHHDRQTLNARFASSNLPLRGAKGWNYEGGIRVPLIVHWPGKTEPNSKSPALVTGTDFYPTLLEMLNLPAMPEQHQDGRSFVPALMGEEHDRGPIFWHFPHYSNHGFQSPNGAVRSGNYKLIEYYENGTVQLFDLDADIGEKNDLSASKPDVTRRLTNLLHNWRDEVDAKMPYPKTAASKPAPGARVRDARVRKPGKRAKIVFISGKPSHGPMKHEHRAGNMILADALNRSGLDVETVVVPHPGYPQDKSVFKDAATVVIFCTGHKGHVLNPHLDDFDELMKVGTGVVMIHWATEAEKGEPGDKFLEWMGGFCDLDWSVNPHWAPNFHEFPSHPITNGVEPFSVHDEWYYHMRFVDEMKGVTPILFDLPPPESLRRRDGARSGNPAVRKAVAAGEEQVVAWAYDRPNGGRGFGFTGAHNHTNWQDEDFRRVVLNAILWTAHVKVPKDGCPSPEISESRIKENLDDKK